MLATGVNKALDSVGPKNYSSFRYQITRKLPKITQQQTKRVMSAFLRSIIAAKEAAGFGISIATNLVSK